MFRWKNWIGAAASVALLMVSSCASWTPQQREYTEYGAAGGAFLGGGLGCGIAAATSGHSGVGKQGAAAFEIGCPVGVVGGALIGGTIGYLIAPKPAPPPLPPPPPPVSYTHLTLPTN